MRSLKVSIGASSNDETEPVSKVMDITITDRINFTGGSLVVGVISEARVFFSEIEKCTGLSTMHACFMSSC